MVFISVSGLLFIDVLSTFNLSGDPLSLWHVSVAFVKIWEGTSLYLDNVYCLCYESKAYFTRK